VVLKETVVKGQWEIMFFVYSFLFSLFFCPLQPDEDSLLTKKSIKKITEENEYL
jgi:hypothetical protein